MAIRKLFTKIAKAVKWEHLDDSAVRTNTIQDEAITEPKYASDSVSERAIADGAVSSPKLAPSAIGTAQLANGAVTPDKMATDAKNKALFGLGNVDNTSDEDKPVSDAVQLMLDQREPSLPSAGTGASSKFLRGDKTFVRLDTPTVFANTSVATGNLDSITAPGVYQYLTASNLPSGAGSTGTLTVGSISASARTHLLIDSQGYAWTRTYSGSTWTAWRSLSPAGSPSFFGSITNQTHTANSEERCNVATTLSSNGLTNSNGELTLPRTGKYLVLVNSTGPWKQDAAGFGRSLRLHLNGATVMFTDTDVPVVWGSGVGAFDLTLMALITASSGAKLEARMYHNTNKSIAAHHRVSVEWRE